MNDQCENPSSHAVGYKHAPVHTRFQPEISGNPSGARKRKSPASLEEAITAKLNEPLRNPGGHRGGMTRRTLMIRNLVNKSVLGDKKALADLIHIRKEAGAPRLRKPEKISFQAGLKRLPWNKLTDEFYAQQDKDKAEYRKKMRGINLPLADLIDRELARRIKVTRGNRQVRVSMQDIIVNHFTNEATKDGAVAKLLQKLIPENASSNRPSFVEIAKPNAEEQEWLAGKHERELQLERENLKEEFPDRDWTNWTPSDGYPKPWQIHTRRI